MRKPALNSVTVAELLKMKTQEEKVFFLINYKQLNTLYSNISQLKKSNYAVFKTHKLIEQENLIQVIVKRLS